MKKTIYYLLGMTIFFSCKEQYTPEIMTDLKVLAVDGLLTDSVGLTYVKLKTTSPYSLQDTLDYGTAQYNATIYITDNLQNSYNFIEKTPGYYVPVDSNFKATPGNTYVLNLTTSDGNNYVSSPQKVLPNNNPELYYLNTDVKDLLLTNAYGDTKLEVKDIYNVCLDIESTDNETPRFRFKTKEYVQYLISKVVPRDVIKFFCWYSIINDDGLIFTDEKYPTHSKIIKNFPVEWFYKEPYITVPDMSLGTLNYDTIFIDERAYTRIIRINQFRINDDTYQYHKGMSKQSSDQGKIFDPITTQLYGNIKCSNDTNKLVLGFFETSSVKTITYAISSFNLDKIIQIPNFLPPPQDKGFIVAINNPMYQPPFWVPIRSLD